MPRGGKRPGSGPKPTGKKRVKTSITFPAEKLARLDRYAGDEGTTRSLFLEKLLDKLEIEAMDKLKGFMTIHVCPDAENIDEEIAIKACQMGIATLFEKGPVQ